MTDYSDEYLTEFVKKAALDFKQFAHLNNEDKSGMLYALIVNTAITMKLAKLPAVGACQQATHEFLNYDLKTVVATASEDLNEAIQFIKQKGMEK